MLVFSIHSVLLFSHNRRSCKKMSLLPHSHFRLTQEYVWSRVNLGVLCFFYCFAQGKASRLVKNWQLIALYRKIYISTLQILLNPWDFSLSYWVLSLEFFSFVGHECLQNVQRKSPPGAGDLKRCFSIHVKLMFIFQMSR